MPTPLQQHRARRLADSIDRLHKEVEQVEFWASAVSGCTQPVPTTSRILLRLGITSNRFDPCANVAVGAANQNDRRDAKPASA